MRNEVVADPTREEYPMLKQSWTFALPLSQTGTEPPPLRAVEMSVEEFMEVQEEEDVVRHSRNPDTARDVRLRRDRREMLVPEAIKIGEFLLCERCESDNLYGITEGITEEEESLAVILCESLQDYTAEQSNIKVIFWRQDKGNIHGGFFRGVTVENTPWTGEIDREAITLTAVQLNKASKGVLKRRKLSAVTKRRLQELGITAVAGMK